MLLVAKIPYITNLIIIIIFDIKNNFILIPLKPTTDLTNYNNINNFLR